MNFTDRPPSLDEMSRNISHKTARDASQRFEPTTMQTIPILLLSFWAMTRLEAGEYPLHHEIPSPDKRFTAVITQESERISPTIEIKSAEGTSFLTLQTNALKLEWEKAIWSPDNQVLAISADVGHAGFTYLFVCKGKSFVNVSGPKIPDGYDNARIRPVRWIEGRRLILDISGPYAGKADGHFFKGRSTIRISPESPTCEVLYQHISDHDGND